MRERKAEKKPAHDGRKGIRDRVAGFLGIPADALGVTDGFMAELRGKSGVTVKGCRRILAYSEERITLLTRDGAVTVTGSALTCSAYFHGAVGIEGAVDGVFFEERRERILYCLSEQPEKTGGPADEKA